MDSTPTFLTNIKPGDRVEHFPAPLTVQAVNNINSMVELDFGTTSTFGRPTDQLRVLN